MTSLQLNIFLSCCKTRTEALLTYFKTLEKALCFQSQLLYMNHICFPCCKCFHLLKKSHPFFFFFSLKKCYAFILFIIIVKKNILVAIMSYVGKQHLKYVIQRYWRLSPAAATKIADRLSALTSNKPFNGQQLNCLLWTSEIKTAIKTDLFFCFWFLNQQTRKDISRCSISEERNIPINHFPVLSSIILIRHSPGHKLWKSNSGNNTSLLCSFTQGKTLKGILGRRKCKVH